MRTRTLALPVALPVSPAAERAEFLMMTGLLAAGVCDALYFLIFVLVP